MTAYVGLSQTCRWVCWDGGGDWTSMGFASDTDPHHCSIPVRSQYCKIIS